MEEKQADNREELKRKKREKFVRDCKADADLKGFTGKKRELLFALKLSFGNFTRAVAMVGLSRKTIYNYCNDDPNFKAMVDDIKEMSCDFVDDKLMSRIQDDDVTAMIWWDKTRGKYREIKIDHTSKGEKLTSSPIMFIPAESLTPDQIEKYLNDQAGASNEGIS